MDIGVIVSAGALLVSFWLAFLQWRRYQKDKKLADKADMAHDFRAPAERDSIIVAGAEQAVTVLKLSLVDTREENERLQKRIDQQDVLIAEQAKRIRHLEHEIAKLINEGKP